MAAPVAVAPAGSSSEGKSNLSTGASERMSWASLPKLIRHTSALAPIRLSARIKSCKRRKCCAKMAAGSPDMEPEVSIRMNIGNRAVVMVR
jgi:hypothetical protein